MATYAPRPVGPAGPQGPPMLRPPVGPIGAPGPTGALPTPVPPTEMASPAAQLTPSLVPGAPGHAILAGSATPPAPAAPAVNAAEFSPDNQYVDAFNASMATQRKAIDNALASSMVQLGARREAASKVVAGIPQQIKDTYAQTDTKQSGVMQAANDAIGPNGAVGGDANAALYANDNLAARQSGQAVQPLLAAGVQSNYDLGESGLNQAHLEGLSQLSSQQAQFTASLAAGEQAHNYAMQDRQYAVDHPNADPSMRITPYQQAQLDADRENRAAARDQQTTEQTYQRESAAQSEGYTGLAGKQKGENLAKFWRRPPNLDTKTLGQMYDYDTLLALHNFKGITDAEFFKATGTTPPKSK